MSQIISVVPNLCEGRDEAFIESLRMKLWAVRGLTVLDVSMDQVRNRTIFSFTGRKDAIFEGGYVLYQEALERIDMRQHQGEYPRIGAAGVSAVPDSARVAHMVGQAEDPTNYLLQHAMGPNVAGVIGSAIAAGVFLGLF